MYHGDIHLGDTIDIKFVTTAAATGAPTTLSGVPVISAYVDNSTTELTAGITLTVDFDTRTGLNNVRVVASSGNGYTASTNVQLVITTGTVGGTSAVGYVVGSFSIDKRPVNVAFINSVATTSVTTVSANQGTTQPLNFTGTAGSALVKGDTIDLASQVVTAAAGVTFPTSVASPTNITGGTITTVTNLTNAPTAGDFTVTMKTSIGTAVAASAVASVTGNVGGNVNGNVVGSVASVTARVTANTDQLAGQTVTAGAGVTFPSSVASPTNITAGTITTATTVTNGVTLAAAAIDSASLATTGKTAIADAVLDRDMSVGTDSGTEIVRTPRQALRVLRNKVDIPNGKVKKEDDATDSWTFAVTTAAGNPVTVVDPT